MRAIRNSWEVTPPPQPVAAIPSRVQTRRDPSPALPEQAFVAFKFWGLNPQQDKRTSKGESAREGRKVGTGLRVRTWGSLGEGAWQRDWPSQGDGGAASPCESFAGAVRPSLGCTWPLCSSLPATPILQGCGSPIMHTVTSGARWDHPGSAPGGGEQSWTRI